MIPDTTAEQLCLPYARDEFIPERRSDRYFHTIPTLCPACPLREALGGSIVGTTPHRTHATRHLMRRQNRWYSSEVAIAYGALHVGLFHRLDRDNSHGGPTHRFADRFRISPIILGGLDIGLDILRAHQLNGMPALFKRPAPVMRSPARLHPDHTWRQTRHRVPHLTSLHARRLSTARPRASAPCNWKTFFAKSMSIKASPFFLTMSVRNSCLV